MMHPERRITHYTIYDKILLVGEGDFSFSASVATALGTATSMVATSLDSEAMVMSKYPTAWINLNTLRRLGGIVLHGVNVHYLSDHFQLCRQEFDKVVFNFPHAGFFGGMGEANSLQIERHRALLRGFFRNARTLLRIDGEIHVTHKTSYPYCDWNIQDIARDAGLHLLAEVEFYKYDYPGYENKKGDGTESNETFPVGRCSTFKFVDTVDYSEPMAFLGRIGHFREV